MDIKELINNGWARHDKEPEALAGDLEEHFALAETPAHVGAFIQLSNHTIGEHLGDWARACTLAEKAMADRDDAPDLAGPYGSLAVAQYLAGRAPDALASEAHAVRLSGADKLSPVVRTRMIAAGALIGSKRFEEGAKVYDAALALVRSVEDELDCDRAVAVTSNNLASELVEKPERSPAEDALMLEAAQAAREFWKKCGTWENEERAEYLLALVHNKLGQPDKALEHAGRAIEVIRGNGKEDVDEAFLNLAMAGSWNLKEDRKRHEEALARADTLAKPRPGFKGLVRAKVEW